MGMSDRIISQPSNAKYRANFDAAFRKPQKVPSEQTYLGMRIVADPDMPPTEVEFRTRTQVTRLVNLEPPKP
jgi:hypothetical protein